MAFILTLTIVFIGLAIYRLTQKSKRNFPPGPWNILPRFLQSHLTYMEMAKTYGHIFQTKFGVWDAVVIDDPKLIRQAFNNPAISDRLDHKLFTVMTEPSHGVSSENGPEWLELRRYVLRTLRDFGFGKQSAENLVMDEVRDFLNWMKANEGMPVAMDRRFVLATVNSLWTLIAGERHDQENKAIDEIVEKANSLLLETLASGNMLMNFPQLLDILPKAFFPTWATLTERAKPFMQIFSNAVNYHIENPVDQSQPRDLIDTYLNEIKRTENQNSVFFGEKALQQLTAVITDLYTAGEATTSVTLNWSVLYLVRFPNVQRKLQKELDLIVGKNRPVSLADRPTLPYTTALMNEILRYSSIAPIGVFHKVTEDTTLAGYDLQKGTLIISNLYSVHHSKEIWEDPENFRPERFLNDAGETVKNDNLMAFSTGKRQCLGESLARDNFFLFLTNMFLRFDITADPANPEPTLDTKVGFLREPFRFKEIMSERNN